ncbi:MAG TPA: hypothetical protein VN897_10165, partial [Mycobacterium sp.]|nr:hypothetical protein [Mycobacterium sp.]
IHESRAQALAAGDESHQDITGHFHARFIEFGSAPAGHELGQMRQDLAAQSDSPYLELCGI